MKYTRRKDFRFYRSYFDVLNELESEADQLAFLKALINRQFLGQEPELTGISKFAYVSQQHAIEQQCKGWEQKKGIKLNSPENRGAQGVTQPPPQGGTQGGTEGGPPPPPLQRVTSNKQLNNYVSEKNAAADVKSKRLDFLEILHNEIKNNAEWWNSFCMSVGVDITKGEEMIKHFAIHTRAEEKPPTSFSDFKEHFRNYFRKPQIQRKFKTKFYT